MESRYIKNYSYGQTYTDNLEKTIAMLYCLSLPFRMITQLSFLKSFFGVCANYLPFIFHIVGMILWLVNGKGRLRFEGKEKLASHAIKLLIWLNASSIIMAIVIQRTYGNHGLESAYRGIAGMLVYFTQYLLMFLYNYRVFRLLSTKEINKLLHVDCIILLVMGYIQVLVMNGIGTRIYDRINIFGVMNSSVRLGKLSLTGNEGATAGCIIGVFVLPYVLSQIIYGHRQYILELLLWTIPLFFTYSSTAYILAAADIAFFILLSIFYSENPLRSLATLGIIIFCIVSLVFIMLNTGVLNDQSLEKIDYLLLRKATDDGNQSTVQRTVPLYVNWGSFTEYPILGVGNGLQGYFFEKYLPEDSLKKGGEFLQYNLNKSKQEIGNGSIFIPSLLSGYGIVGCIFILVFLWHCIKENRKERFISQNLYFTYLFTGLAIFIVGFSGDLYGMYFAWFMLSIPFISKKEECSSK